jgi:hypothetical protein
MTSSSLSLPAVPSASRRSLSLAAVFVAVALLSLAVPAIPHVAKTVITLVNLVVIVLYLGLRKTTGPTDYLEVIVPYSALHVMYFGVGSIYLASNTKVLPLLSLRPYLTSALLLGTVGFFAFLGGYAWLFRRASASRMKGLVPRGAGAAIFCGALGAAGYAAAEARSVRMSQVPGLPAVLSILQSFIPLFYFAWFLVWAVFWHEPRRFRNRVALAGLVPVAFAVGFLTIGSKESCITIVAFPVLAYAYVRRKVPLKSFVALVLLLVFVIFPLYNTYRHQERSLGAVTRLERSVDDARGWDTKDYVDRSVRAFFGRMAVITSVAAIQKDVGKWVDYAKGRTLILAPIGIFIPRFLWPDKPVLSIGHEFGVTFNLISVTDQETNIAPTMIGEFYWNFGIPGVVIGMLLMGAGCRWFYERYGRSEGFDPVRRSAYMALLPAVLHSEGAVAIVVAGVVKGILVIAVTVFLLRGAGAFGRTGAPGPAAAP